MVSSIFVSIGCCCPPIPFPNRPWYLSINMMSFMLPFFPPPVVTLPKNVSQDSQHFKWFLVLPRLSVSNEKLIILLPKVYINLHQFPIENSEMLRFFCTQPHLHTNSHWRKGVLGHLLTSVTPEFNWKSTGNYCISQHKKKAGKSKPRNSQPGLASWSCKTFACLCWRYRLKPWNACQSTEKWVPRGSSCQCESFSQVVKRQKNTGKCPFL